MDTKASNIYIQDRLIIGNKANPYCIAEIGTNHNSSIETAKKLIESAANAKFDCVKFQVYEPYEIVSPQVKSSNYGLDKTYGDISALEMFDKYLKTPKSWFPELIEFSKGLGIDTCVTLHGEESIDWAKKFQFDLIKIASMDHNNIPLLEYLIKNTENPILISFGLAIDKDIEIAINTLKKHKHGFAAFHCVSVYPPKQSELRITNIKFLREKYKINVGFSDHTIDDLIALNALSIGANFFEKHITLDSKSVGPDHSFALMPNEMISYVSAIKEYSKEINKNIFLPPSQRETINRNAYMKSAIAKKDLLPGEILFDGMFYFARPGTGIPPTEYKKIIGKKVRKLIEKDTLICKDDLIN